MVNAPLVLDVTALSWQNHRFDFFKKKKRKSIQTPPTHLEHGQVEHGQVEHGQVEHGQVGGGYFTTNTFIPPLITCCWLRKSSHWQLTASPTGAHTPLMSQRKPHTHTHTHTRTPRVPPCQTMAGMQREILCSLGLTHPEVDSLQQRRRRRTFEVRLIRRNKPTDVFYPPQSQDVTMSTVTVQQDSRSHTQTVKPEL